MVPLRAVGGAAALRRQPQAGWVNLPSKVMASEIDVHAEVSVACRSGLSGSAIGRRLAAAGFSDMLTAPRPLPDAACAHAPAGA